MTLAEFKAWFAGYTEELDGPPNAKQWQRICARVAEVDGAVMTYPVVVHRYPLPYQASQVLYGAPGFQVWSQSTTDHRTIPMNFTQLGHTDAVSDSVN